MNIVCFSFSLLHHNNFHMTILSGILSSHRDLVIFSFKLKLLKNHLYYNTGIILFMSEIQIICRFLLFTLVLKLVNISPIHC